MRASTGLPGAPAPEGAVHGPRPLSSPLRARGSLPPARSWRTPSDVASILIRPTPPTMIGADRNLPEKHMRR